MPAINNILFPLDFSERCETMAPAVRLWAGSLGVPVTLLHAISLPVHGEREFATLRARLEQEMKTASTKALEEFSASLFPGITVEPVVIMGDAGHAIVTEAHRRRNTLIMLPTHSFGPFRRFLVGSVAAKVLHDAQCPVWTTAHAERGRVFGKGAPKTILCGIDNTPATVGLIRWAQYIAGKYGAELKLVHAMPAVDEQSDNRGEKAVRRHWLTRARQELTPLLAEAGAKAELILHGGPIPEVLAMTAKEVRADLLIIGRGQMQKRLGRLRTHSLGIVTKSPCPVISV